MTHTHKSHGQGRRNSSNCADLHNIGESPKSWRSPDGTAWVHTNKTHADTTYTVVCASGSHVCVDVVVQAHSSVTNIGDKMHSHCHVSASLQLHFFFQYIATSMMPTRIHTATNNGISMSAMLFPASSGSSPSSSALPAAVKSSLYFK